MVVRQAALAEGAATVSRLGADSVDLVAAHTGAAHLQVRFSPYWAVVRGSACVASDGGGWTRLDVRTPGILRIATRFSLRRIVSRGPRCAG